MRISLDSPILRELRARGLLFPVTVLLAVGFVLLHGALRPDPNEYPAGGEIVGPPPPPATPAPLLNMRPSLEKTALSYEDDYWLQLGEQAGAKMVLLDGAFPAAVVAPGLALTSHRAAEELLELRRLPGDPDPTDGPSHRLLGWDPLSEVALFAVNEDAPVFSVANPESLRPGSSVAAVSLTADRRLRVTPGHLASTSSSVSLDWLDLALPFPDNIRAAAVVNLDGALVGLATESSRGVHVLSADGAAHLAQRLKAAGPCIALETEALDDLARKVLRVPGGLLVSRVWPDAFVGERRPQAGDVLLLWDSRRLDSVEALEADYTTRAAGDRIRIVILRNGRRLRFNLVLPDAYCRPTETAPWRLPALGLSLSWHQEPLGEQTLRVAAVEGSGPAALAGLEQADVIIAVDGRTLDRAGVRRRLEASPQQPVLLTVRRGEHVTLRTLDVGGGQDE